MLSPGCARSTADLTVIQLLAPRQRAVLILRDVLDRPASEVAALMDSSVPAVKSALQRARRRCTSTGPTTGRPRPAPPPTSTGSCRGSSRRMSGRLSPVLSAGRQQRRPEICRRAPGLPGGSSALAGTVYRLERERLREGAVTEARDWFRTRFHRREN